MATIAGQANPVTPPPGVQATTSNYITSFDLADQWLPDLKEELMTVRSRGSLTGFLDFNGNKEGFSADQFRWAEEGERHVIHESTVTRSGNVLTFNGHSIRPNINILISDVANNLQVLAHVSSTTTNTFTVIPYGYADLSTAGLGTAGLTVFTAGSEFAKGSDGQTESLESQLDIYSNKPIIMADIYKVNNSDLTNRGWVNVEGNYFWFDLQFEETMLRMMDEMEVGLLTAEETDATSPLTLTGTEGYFAALKNRGITSSGQISSVADLKALIKLWDKVHAESSYYGYLSRDQEQSLDELFASLNAGYDGGADYGMFANADGEDGKNKALSLGFKGMKWGGYNFMYQTWNLLKDPTKFGSDALAASGKVHGVLFPHGTMALPANPIEGTPAKRVPYLTMMYKEMPGYSREFEKFMLGSGRIATPTSAGDYLQMNLRTERGLRTVGARKQVIITG